MIKLNQIIQQSVNEDIINITKQIKDIKKRLVNIYGGDKLKKINNQLDNMLIKIKQLISKYNKSAQGKLNLIYYLEES